MLGGRAGILCVMGLSGRPGRGRTKGQRCFRVFAGSRPGVPSSSGPSAMGARGSVSLEWLLRTIVNF